MISTRVLILVPLALVVHLSCAFASSVVGYRARRAANADVIYDDIALCDDDLTTTSTHCTD